MSEVSFKVTDDGVRIPDRTFSGSRRRLTAKPLLRDDFKPLWEAMQADGITFQQTQMGYTFNVGAYQVTNKEIARVWELSQSAMYRFITWLLEGGV